MARTSARISEAVPQHRLDAIAQQVRGEGAVTVRALGLGKLGRSEHAELLSALGRAGLEHTGKAVRVPLREQVHAAVTRAGPSGLGASALASDVKGARSGAELQLALQALLTEGVLVELASAGERRLALRGPQLLTDGELEQLARVAEQLAGLAKASRAQPGRTRRTLPRSALDAPRVLLNQLAGPRPAPEPKDAVQALVQAAFQAAPASVGLIRVPDVIEALEALQPREALLAATRELARQGALELRPEASIGRLAEDQRARCPRAPDGTPLSYARLTPRTGGAAP